MPKPTPRSVANLKSKILNPSLTSHFEVEMNFPGPVRELIGSEQEKLMLSCSEASLPGSQLTTLEQTYDRTGVTEKFAYRRQFDDRIDLTFYVDSNYYLPIRVFEKWISFIMNEEVPDQDLKDPDYHYRAKYPDSYRMDGMKITKFERDYRNTLEYEFVKVFPLSISSMPVSYDASSLLKCSVSLSYIRYIVKDSGNQRTPQFNLRPSDQARLNSAAFAGGLANLAVDTITGNDFLGDVSGGVVGALTFLR